MEYEIDEEGLRKDMQDDYGTAMFSGFPMAMMGVVRVEQMSTRELVCTKERCGFEEVYRLTGENERLGI